jgi:hypothetical protein
MQAEGDVQIVTLIEAFTMGLLYCIQYLKDNIHHFAVFYFITLIPNRMNYTRNTNGIINKADTYAER